MLNVVAASSFILFNPVIVSRLVSPDVIWNIPSKLVTFLVLDDPVFQLDISIVFALQQANIYDISVTSETLKFDTLSVVLSNPEYANMYDILATLLVSKFCIFVTLVRAGVFLNIPFILVTFPVLNTLVSNAIEEILLIPSKRYDISTVSVVSR